MSHEDLVPGSSRSWEPIQMENPYKDPPKRCILCGINVDYKNVQLLSQFVSPHTGCIYGRHITGLCDKKQKEITKAIKRAHVLVICEDEHHALLKSYTQNQTDQE
ncbi:28S ribosomal protein S18c, mitochondrial isoform X3 [Egretta garzetta]|uniref:28S ribosomal protein S18c, mitochondrial isoform X3 n=1 Tax=Egretta garzetta TaxID=188379 RepID=UPI00163C56D5|nr:28S ribosomal protein S18c, mitochondrial isoform X3 [Egretta garzetta]